MLHIDLLPSTGVLEIPSHSPHPTPTPSDALTPMIQIGDVPIRDPKPAPPPTPKPPPTNC
ncbi:MAG: hypothetical protein HYZ45_13315 [Burkholderiales bacterium]|nr:hypothetical protein [Burkholderiales bacterium]